MSSAVTRSGAPAPGLATVHAAFTCPGAKLLSLTLARFRVGLTFIVKQETLVRERIMQANPVLSAMTAAIFVVASPALSIAQVQRASPSTEVARACTQIDITPTAADSPAAMACAKALQKSLESSRNDLTVLAAGKYIDKSTPMLMLAKHGLTPGQLEGAEIVVTNETGGTSATRIKSIPISCCPLTIVIEF
jgi:hypothetical protein